MIELMGRSEKMAILIEGENVEGKEFFTILYTLAITLKYINT